MSKHFPAGYRPLMEQKQTERAIKFIKDTFERELSGGLRLSRVTSPRFVPSGSGINDDLNGIERPVRFEVGNLNNQEMEVVQSLAKWKRMALADHGYPPGSGIYTDMDAIRPDDELDPIHSIYVDQWDWELTITEEQRTLTFLKQVVRKIYSAMIRTEFLVSEMFPVCQPILPKEIKFIHTEDAQREYPHLSPEEREKVLAKKHGAIFLIGIGSPLADGISHGGRAPDYDDWSTPSGDGYTGLNGDIVVWDTVREEPMELSSMGIRVDRDVLLKQLAIRGMEERAQLYWHQRLLNGELPLCIGGGFGQSRFCMYLLKKAHIGEVQASVWPEDVRTEAQSLGIFLL
jgi:aspartate--ammonia ligase